MCVCVVFRVSGVFLCRKCVNFLLAGFSLFCCCLSSYARFSRSMIKRLLLFKKLKKCKKHIEGQRDGEVEEERGRERARVKGAFLTLLFIVKNENWAF